jgi:hypothetical protein
LPSNLEIVATNNETGIVTGIYKPLMRDGSFTIIIPPNSNYTLSYQQDGEEFYSELMEVPADAAYQEINREVKLKGVNFGQPVNVTAKDSTQPAVTNKEIAYISVGGRLLDKDNKPMNNMKVNLMNSEGQVVKTTTSDALGWFLFSELPQNQNYVVALDETDTEIGKKSFVEFRDAEGKVIKTKNLGSGKFQMASSNTTVKFKAKDKPAPVHHEQLASVKDLEFKMNFKYNVTEIDINDEPFKQFINNLMDLYNKNGSINLKIVSSASTVPTRAFSSNKELSVARADKGKNQIINALKEKGADVSKIKIVSIKSQVGGPQYSIDYIQNKEKYEQYQFIKASAY